MATTSKFCVEFGHDASTNKYASNRRVTRSRTKTVCDEITLGDILYDNRMCAKPSYKRMIDAFVAQQFTKRGIVDDIALAEHVCEVSVNMQDDGHMTVIGYIVGKYCDAGNADVKRFLRDYRKNFASFSMYQVMVKTLFGMIPVVKNGNLHFRKFTGYVCAAL